MLCRHQRWLRPHAEPSPQRAWTKTRQNRSKREESGGIDRDLHPRRTAAGRGRGVERSAGELPRLQHQRAPLRAASAMCRLLPTCPRTRSVRWGSTPAPGVQLDKRQDAAIRTTPLRASPSLLLGLRKTEGKAQRRVLSWARFQNFGQTARDRFLPLPAWAHRSWPSETTGRRRRSGSACGRHSPHPAFPYWIFNPVRSSGHRGDRTPERLSATWRAPCAAWAEAAARQRVRLGLSDWGTTAGKR